MTPLSPRFFRGPATILGLMSYSSHKNSEVREMIGVEKRAGGAKVLPAFSLLAYR
jgi:hypothetical protein